MKKILVFAGSNSSKSINQHLVSFAASEVQNNIVEKIKLTDFTLPMFGEDIEREEGYSENLKALNKKIQEADALILSVNEHNGTVSAFFKNIVDWLSRLDRNFLSDKKILVMSTSNGKRGAVSALKFTKNVLPRFGAEVVESFSLPSFSTNFSIEEKTITDQTLLPKFTAVLRNFERQIEL